MSTTNIVAAAIIATAIAAPIAVNKVDPYTADEHRAANMVCYVLVTNPKGYDESPFAVINLDVPTNVKTLVLATCRSPK